MACMICLEKITDNFIFADCNLCKIKYHQYCYQEFKNKSSFNCPICRNTVKKNYTNDPIFDYVFSYPAPIALFVWFIISFVFTLFLFPQFISYHMFEHSKLFSISVSIIHLCSVIWVCYLLTM